MSVTEIIVKDFQNNEDGKGENLTLSVNMYVAVHKYRWLPAIRIHAQSRSGATAEPPLPTRVCRTRGRVYSRSSITFNIVDGGSVCGRC